MASSDTRSWLVAPVLEREAADETGPDRADRSSILEGKGYVPINLKPGVEMNQVVDDVARQIKDISDRIKNASANS
jgi:hypothetical protein